jgi:hypothetical protein
MVGLNVSLPWVLESLWSVSPFFRCINQFISLFISLSVFLCYRILYFMVFVPPPSLASFLSIIPSSSEINRWSASSNFHCVRITCLNLVLHGAALCKDTCVLRIGRYEPMIIVLSFSSSPSYSTFYFITVVLSVTKERCPFLFPISRPPCFLLLSFLILIFPISQCPDPHSSAFRVWKGYEQRFLGSGGGSHSLKGIVTSKHLCLLLMIIITSLLGLYEPR